MISDKKAYDIVKMALREIGMVSLGDSIDAAVAQEALLLLNGIRASWSLNIKNYKIYDQTYTATTSLQVVQLGPGGNIETRPNNITQVTVISGTPGLGINYTLGILPYEAYQQLAITNVVAIPQNAYIDTSYPVQNVWLYPGLAANWSIRVMGTSYMTEYEFLDDPYMDPPEYFDPLYSELALTLAPKYGVVLDGGTLGRLSSRLKHIKTQHFAQSLRPMPNGLIKANPSFNFYGGM